MPRRHRSTSPSRRRRSRELLVEGLEQRRLLAANVAVASDAGPASQPLVRLVDAETGAERASVMAFESTFKGGVRLAMGRVTGNAAPDIVAGSGSGRVAEVRVFKPVTSGATTTLQQVLSFLPFGPSYRGGIEVAVGNVDGDASEDIIVSKSREGGDVRVFRMTSPGGTLTQTLYATIAKPFGAAYTGGSSVGVADVGEFSNGGLVKNIGDNKVEILVGSGVGIPARVLVYDVSRPSAPRIADTIRPSLPSWFQGGVSVSGGRYAASGVADSIDDIFVSAGRGGASQTFVYDGTVGAAANRLLRFFAPFASLARPNAATFTAPVDVDGNGQIDRFLVTQGDPGGPAGISNVSIAGVRSTAAVTTLTGPLRVAAARTVFANQTVNGIVADPTPTPSFAPGTSRPMTIREIVTGSGAVANTWDKLTVQYTGLRADGFEFDTSRDNGVALPLTLGVGGVISGWEAGLVGMKVGGRRLLVIPPELAYGDNGSPPNIPSAATLTFDVELVSVVANQAATIGGASTGAVTEDATPSSVSGTLTVTDPDDTTTTPARFRESVFAAPAAASLSGTYGAFTFNASTGAWTYTLDNTKPATQALTAGQTVTDTLAVTSRDGTASRSIVITVTGAGDTATIGGTATGSLTAGVGAMTAAGTLTVTDADAGQSAFAVPTPAALDGTYGAFTFNATTRAWAYALDTSRPATLLLRAPNTVTDSFTATSVDGTASRPVTVTITGFTLQTTTAATRVVSGDIPVGTERTMQYADIVPGTGTATATAGKTLKVNYLGMKADGTVFNSWRLLGTFVLGVQPLIAGFDAGLVGMKAGGQRLLVIPPELAYGDAGAEDGSLANETLIFKIELVSIT